MTGDPQLPLFTASAAPGDTARRVVLSYGLGVDSTAVLVRWLLEPASRDFALEDLVVVTAMTGDEHNITGALVQRHVLPLLAAHGVRYAQVARASGSQTDGITVLSDSAAPDRLHLRGAFKLSDELTAAGTVPQAGGARLCSAKAKGAPLDAYIASVLGAEPYRHAIGFESTELRRAQRDARFNTGQRTGIYPLIDWNWDRQTCLNYLERTFGVSEWPKSCCTYCVYALATQDGRRRMFDAYDREPAAGVQALMLERLAVALNPNQGLAAGKRVDLFAAAAGRDRLLEDFESQLERAPHCLYEIRRIIRPAGGDPTRKGNASRHSKILARGSRAQARAALHRSARHYQVDVDSDDGIQRVWLARRRDSYPAVEHFLVAAPAGAIEKGDPHFERWWRQAVSAAAAAHLQAA